MPSIAALFDVSVDELLGCSSAKGLGDICLNIKDYFSALPEKESFENAYRLAAPHTSVAILDALKAVSIPAVEVHISDVDSRESFRQISYPGMYCEKTIKGHGLPGYVMAIKYLKEKYEKKTL